MRPEATMTSRFTIGQKLYAGGGTLALLVVALGAIAWWSTASIQARFEQTANRTARRLTLVLEAKGQFETATSAQQSLLLEAILGNTDEVTAQDKKVRQSLETIKAKFAALDALVADDEGRRTVETLRGHIGTTEKFHEEFTALIKANQPTEAYAWARPPRGCRSTRPRRPASRPDVKGLGQSLDADIAAGQLGYRWARVLTVALFLTTMGMSPASRSSSSAASAARCSRRRASCATPPGASPSPRARSRSRRRG